MPDSGGYTCVLRFCQPSVGVQAQLWREREITSAPASLTLATPSFPAVAGKAGLIGYLPCIWLMSDGLIGACEQVHLYNEHRNPCDIPSEVAGSHRTAKKSTNASVSPSAAICVSCRDKTSLGLP